MWVLRKPKRIKWVGRANSKNVLTRAMENAVFTKILKRKINWVAYIMRAKVVILKTVLGSTQ